MKLSKVYLNIIRTFSQVNNLNNIWLRLCLIIKMCDVYEERLKITTSKI